MRWIDVHYWLDGSRNRDDAFHIDDAPCRKAVMLAIKLESGGVPPPKSVGLQGPKSAVLSWEGEGKVLFLTISEDKAAVRLDGPAGIAHRETFELGGVRHPVPAREGSEW